MVFCYTERLLYVVGSVITVACRAIDQMAGNVAVLRDLLLLATKTQQCTEFNRFAAQVIHGQSSSLPLIIGSSFSPLCHSIKNGYTK